MLNALKRLVYHTTRAVTWPLRYYFGRSFDRVHDHMARQYRYLLSRLDDLERRVAERDGGLEAEVVAGYFTAHERTLATLEERLAARLQALEQRLADPEVVTEFFAVHRYILRKLEAQMEGMEGRLEEVAAHAGLLPQLDQRTAELLAHSSVLPLLDTRIAEIAAHASLLPQIEARTAETAAHASLVPQLEQRVAEVAQRSADLAAQTLVNRSLAELGEGGADLLNYASSHRGFAAQAGLWINHPVVLNHRRGKVELDRVNERIVELPYVLGALACLPAGSHILDFGATESLLALYLASLGHDVVALDQRPYLFTHPRLCVVTCLAEEWEGPQRPFDAIVSLSTLEHVGLGHYGDRQAPLDLDRQILERFRDWLRPEGRLILTAPYGQWNVDELQRTYDAEHLAALLDGWEIMDRRYAVSTVRQRWDVVQQEPPPSIWWDPDTRGVVLLQAKPRA